MEEGTVIESITEPAVELGSESDDDAHIEPGEAEDIKTTDARLPEFSSWLPGRSVWLYVVPVILLLFLWLFYPVILILICIILVLWLLD